MMPRAALSLNANFTIGGFYCGSISRLERRSQCSGKTGRGELMRWRSLIPIRCWRSHSGVVVAVRDFQGGWAMWLISDWRIDRI